jgi:hypothetical protein
MSRRLVSRLRRFVEIIARQMRKSKEPARCRRYKGGMSRRLVSRLRRFVEMIVRQMRKSKTPAGGQRY